MAVLIEGISVVIRVDAIKSRYPGGWEAFKANAPNATCCSDRELVRVGFMAPRDARDFVKSLEDLGLIYLEGGTARDMVAVDQLKGPAAPCETIECGYMFLEDDPERRVLVARLNGSKQELVYTPDDWMFETSLTRSFGYVPEEKRDKSLTFLRHENGLDVYLNAVTGTEVFVGRTGRVVG
ncbi:MAG: hypothetical protein OXQ29_17200 [Rhodospirillaceae bacterium]|nr:hypothetical protein [Rhodospirillaceae bacterium]